MKRLFSPGRSGATSPNPNDNRSRSNSNSRTAQLPTAPVSPTDEISPELLPIVTLLSAQAHRRYNEGIFMLLQSINSDGEPVPNRQWREVYGVLLGTQLAVWDVDELERHQNSTEALMNASSKPDYINFTDSSFRAVDRLENSQGLKNIIIVSTTLKNQYLLQYQEQADFHRWNAAFRLATFEYTSLQEAYTGALLSARGSKLSDIRTILAESKYDYEDWVSVRFGSGMPWKRCFAVIEQPTKKSKKEKVFKGSVSFFKDEKKQKKTAMAIIKDASATYALYPQSHKLVDHSTMIKLEGTVFFDGNKKSLPKEASVYFMPEQHSAVPGYDTLIRFLVPLLDTFALYGRPKRLNANKNEMNSLLFGLPVLPHVHYLEVDDLLLLASSAQSSNWLLTEWRSKIKEILARKLSSGYTGCGSQHGVIGAMNSPAINSGEFLDVRSVNNNNRPASPLTPSFLPQPKFNRDSLASKASSLNELSGGELSVPNSPPKNNRNSEITQIYEDYSNVAQMGRYNKSEDSFSQRNAAPYQQQSQQQQSQQSLGQQRQAYGNGIGYGAGGKLENPYKPANNLSQPNSLGSRSVNSGPQAQQQQQGGLQPSEDPYSNFKQTSHERVNTYLDDDDDFEEDFNKGISALSVNDNAISKNTGGSSDDVFNPAYHGASHSPALKVQTPSKPLPVPNIKVEQVSPYTSGRINSSAPSSPVVPQHQDPYAQQPQQHQQASRPNPGFASNPTGLSKSPAQRFTPLNQEPKPAPPQHQYQQQAQQQTYQQPNPYQQQHAGPRPQQQAAGYPPQHQQQHRPPPPQQQYQQQAPPSQHHQQHHQQQHQQQQHQPYQQTPYQQTPYQQRPPAPQQQAQPRPQQPYGGYPPQQQQRPVQQQRPPPGQQGYPPPQQQGYGRAPVPQQQAYPLQQQQGYPPQQQQRPQIPRAQHEYGSSHSIPQQQQGFPQHGAPQAQYPTRKPVNNPYGNTTASGASNPYAQGNPYSR